ncbi:hypothetical protein RRG08_038023 [Elysia crispata]|uniref:Uncharacterized protein n=1 Tax=Elysia crispata TaxID=231223 RepID=A0AAE0ZXZ5_9GAST|nr:hypothetical protein RRG08_038023 [Elysia crispata]
MHAHSTQENKLCPSTTDTSLRQLSWLSKERKRVLREFLLIFQVHFFISLDQSSSGTLEGENELEELILNGWGSEEGISVSMERKREGRFIGESDVPLQSEARVSICPPPSCPVSRYFYRINFPDQAWPRASIDSASCGRNLPSNLLLHRPRQVSFLGAAAPCPFPRLLHSFQFQDFLASLVFSSSSSILGQTSLCKLLY